MATLQTPSKDNSLSNDADGELKAELTAERKFQSLENASLDPLDGDLYSIHGEQAAKRRAVGEMIFFAGVNDLRRVKKIANHWRIRVSDTSTCRDYDKRTPLHVAAAEGAYSVVQWLVTEGAEINAMDRFNRTALEEAARNDHLEVVRLLAENGARVFEEGKLLPLDESKIKGLVNTRTGTIYELGWDPEWEINPNDLQLVERIGAGEFGEVYKARWHGSVVAAKVLKRSDEIAVGDFRTEIAILRKIHHPNCTQFLGACTKQTPYVVVTELMACSLADAFHKVMVLPNQRRQVELALDFARGMAYLHSRSQPIIHRDLKPANLMISGNLHADSEQLYLDSGVVKVADFGLSKTLGSVDKHNEQMAMNAAYKLTGETGSYRYMAPEVFRHEPYSLKVDVYSFAIILFQVISCSGPFSGMDPVEAARLAALNGVRPSFPPGGHNNDTQRTLRALVEDCWAPDPDARPSFEDIILRLESILSTLGPHTQSNKGGQGGCCVVQ